MQFIKTQTFTDLFYEGKINLKKRLGQNFLINTNVADKIVNCMSNSYLSSVLEIGAGSGILTRALLQSDISKLVAVEVDQLLISHLQSLEQQYQEKLKIVHADALRITEEHLMKKKFKIIANVPYNISSLLLVKWLKKVHYIDEMIIMLQQEVADRIISKQSSKSYGRISILAQCLCYCEKLFDVYPDSFFPKPKIISSVVKLVPKPNISINNIERLDKICKILFMNKRKKIYTTLKKNFSEVLNIINNLSINTNLRAEDLAAEDFYRISQKVNI